MAPAAPLTLTRGVPATQNTAPIVEHRCLYSYDLRRKQKRWQDGHLRFHTFNKRVMVYDVPRNYIGDTHWRESDLVQDGDEFELDRGVLIQVGEVLGSVTQDLTPLLEKRTKAAEIQVVGETAPKPNVRPKAVQPAVTAVRESEPSQILRPKPLNAVLGTPKGRIGRAALPTKSPFDLRAETENNARQDDHAPKRRRIESPAERNRPQPVCPRPGLTDQQTEKFSGDTPARARGGHTAQGGHIPPIAAKQTPHAATIDNRQSKKGSREARLERGDGDTARAPLDIISPDRHNEAAVKRQSINLSHSNEKSDKSKASKGKGVPRFEGMSETAATHCKRSAINEGTAISKSASSSVQHPTPSHEEPRSQSRLQLIARRPRKKLMYRDLLPQISDELAVWSASQRLSTRHADSRLKGTDHTSLSSLHQLEQDRLQSRMQRQPERLTSMGHDKSTPLSLDSSDEETISTHHKTKQKSIAPVEREQRQSNEHNPQEPMLDRIPPGNSLERHDANQTLARMDELLQLRSERGVFDRQSNPQQSSKLAFDSGSAAEQDQDINTDHEAEPTSLADAPSASKTQVSSSPDPSFHNSHHPPSDQKGAPRHLNAVDISSSNTAPKDIAEDATNDETLTIPSTQDPSIINDPHPTPSPPLFLTPTLNAESIVNPPPSNKQSPPSNSPPPPPPAKPPEIPTPPAPPSHFHIHPGFISHPPPDAARLVQSKNQPALPTFKQPTRRSPRKKPSPAKEAPQIKPTTTSPAKVGVSKKQARQSSGGDGVEQSAEAWSVEAWELFGCGRDGVGCSLNDFNAVGGLATLSG